MTPTPPRVVSVRLLALVAFLAAPLHAQRVSADDPIPSAEAPVTLSPFEVRTDKDVGYTAASALAGGRTDTPLMLTPSAVSVMTDQFIDDIGITSTRDIAEWATNALPGYGANEFATGAFNVFFRGLGSSFPSRNYFRWYTESDNYNTERLEFARGPNGVLFGDANMGGVMTTWTKRPKFDRAVYSAQTRLDSYGGHRATIDLNHPAGKRFAVRVNTLHQSGEGWRDRSFDDRDGAHLAGAIRLGQRSNLRFESEYGSGRRALYATDYFENASYWDGTTVYDGVATPSTTNTGIARFSSTPYFVYIPELPQAGFSDWRNLYRTNGTGLALRAADTRSPQPNAPLLPHSEFNLQPPESVAAVEYKTLTAYIDRRFGDDLFVEFGANRYFFTQTGEGNEITFSDYRVDVNRVTPNGQPNPMFGVPFSENERRTRKTTNHVNELRVIATWCHKWHWLSQRVNVISGRRFDHYDETRLQLYRTNGPNSVVTAPENRFRDRLYWDKPGHGLGRVPVVPGYTFEYLPERLTHQRNILDYAQLAATSTFFNDRLAVHYGGRRDHFYRTAQASSGIPVDSVSGLPQLGATYVPPGERNPVNVVGGTAINDDWLNSYNGGVVWFALPWLGLYGNYSETFTPANAGANLIDGRVPPISISRGWDLGVKLNLLGGKIQGALNYYESRQEDILIGGSNTIEINRLWSNLNRLDLANLAYRDTQSNTGSGYELDLTANPTREFRFTLNFALPRTKVVDIQPGLRAYFDANLPEWQAAADGRVLGVIDPVQIQNDIDAIRNRLSGLTPGTTLNNTVKYTANLYGTYTFSSSGWKGIALGLGGNFRGRNKIGNTLASAYDYIYADSFFLLSAHASYTRKFGRVSARFQVNVSNLLNKDDLVYTGTRDYRVGGTSANPLIRVPNTFRYQDPRKVTLSMTLSL